MAKDVNLTEAQLKIWNDIKDENIEMFGLPNQLVSQYCDPKNIEPDKLYLIIKGPAVIVGLESVLLKVKKNKSQTPKYKFEQKTKFVVVSENSDIE